MPDVGPRHFDYLGFLNIYLFKIGIFESIETRSVVSSRRSSVEVNIDLGVIRDWERKRNQGSDKSHDRDQMRTGINESAPDRDQEEKCNVYCVAMSLLSGNR